MKLSQLSLAVVMSSMMAVSAFAQDPERANSYTQSYKEDRNASTLSNYDVERRKRPEYDQLGKQVGGFLVKPTIDFVTGYNDNIRNASRNEDDALFFNVMPIIRAESQFSRHELNLFAGGNLNFFQGESSENTRGYFLGSDGKYEITPDFNIVGGIGFSDTDEKRAASNGLANGQSVNPIEFQTFDLDLGVNKKFNRLDFSLAGYRRDIDFEDGYAPSGAVIDQDIRDVEIYGTRGRVAYEISPDHKVYFNTEYSDREYDIQSAVDRDSDGFKSAVGLEFSLTNQVTADIWGGYMYRDYENGENVSEPYYGTEVNWYPTPLLSVYGTVDRDVQDSVFLNATSRTVTDFALRAAYEFRRNIIISPGVGYTLGNYETINADDTTWIAGTEIEYLMNNNLSLIGAYRYVNRDTDDAVISILDYDQNIVSLTAKTKF